ncbi:MAG: response regulator [Azoarcus sp.]|nr:response regulator [Azoarcus sp.]
MSEDTNTLPRLLIVDDSRMVRASIIKQVRARFDCREEGDGEAAWEALVVDSTVQVLITDIGMPRLDGYGLIARVRASRIARLQKLPIIVISGDEDDGARERARELGANDFITKGIGTAELVARLDTLTRYGQTSRELDESREALANQSPIDPGSGLTTRAYMNWRASQDLALARRQQGGVSVMVFEIDRIDEVVAQYGHQVAELIAKKLRAILALKVRHEDTVSELGTGKFMLLSPLADMVAASAFAMRLQSAIGKLVMTYRGEQIRVGVSAGVASTYVDGLDTLSRLTELALERLAAAQSAGGGRVFGKDGEITREVIERMLRRAVSVDQALNRLRLGQEDEIVSMLPDLLLAIQPLLQFAERRLDLGLPMARLERLARETATGEESME